MTETDSCSPRSWFLRTRKVRTTKAVRITGTTRGSDEGSGGRSDQKHDDSECGTGNDPFEIQEVSICSPAIDF